jgi:Tfp pilus assembly protein PilF
MPAWAWVLAAVLFLFGGCASDRPVMEVKEEARDFEELGLQSYRQGDFQQAMDDFQRALDHD